MVAIPPVATWGTATKTWKAFFPKTRERRLQLGTQLLLFVFYIFMDFISAKSFTKHINNIYCFISNID